jgi:hypothetical protein
LLPAAIRKADDFDVHRDFRRQDLIDGDRRRRLGRRTSGKNKHQTESGGNNFHFKAPKAESSHEGSAERGQIKYESSYRPKNNIKQRTKDKRGAYFTERLPRFSPYETIALTIIGCNYAG